MKIKYKIERYENDSNRNFFLRYKKGDIRRILLEEIEDYCCKEMKEAIEKRYIVFGEYDSILNRDINLNIIHCFPYPEGACFDELEIKYCPFCAKEFEFIEIKQYERMA